MKKLFIFATMLVAAVVGLFFDSNAAILIAAAPQAFRADYYDNIVTSFDLNAVKYLPELYRRYGNQGADVFDLLSSLGYERMADVTLIQHFEENWINQNFKVNSHAAGAAGAAVSLTLNPDSLTTDNKYYPRVNDIVTFKNEVQALILSIDVTTPSAPVLSVAPLNVLQNIPAVASGEIIIITGNAWSEGSTQPVGRFSGAWKYTNNTQIIKESMGASGTQMTNDTWTKVMDGKNIQGWYRKGLLDIELRQKINIQSVWLTGTPNTNPLVVDNLNAAGAIKTSEGLFPYLNRVGIQYPYTPGTLTVQDYNTIERLMSRQYAKRTVLDMMGQDIDIEMEDVLKEYFQFTGIEYTTKVVNDKLFGNTPDGEAMAATIAFQYFGKAGRAHCIKRFEAMNDPQTFGSDGYAYPGRGVLIPLEKGKDPKTKNSIPSIGMVYKGMGDYSRKAEAWDYGAAGGGQKIGKEHKREWFLRSECSPEFFGGNAFVSMFAQ